MYYKNFSINYSGSTVSVYKNGIAPENFEKELFTARKILNFFRASKPGSVWGCDGVGYEVQKKLGVVQVYKSGVGPRKFNEGINNLTANFKE